MANQEIWVRNARLAFADTIFEKKGIAGDASSKPRYGFTLIIPPDHPQRKEIEDVQRQLVLDHQWKSKEKGADVYKALDKKDRLALKDGDDKKKYEGFEGNLYLSASSDTRPTAVDRDRSPLTKDDGKLYSGCYVNGKVELWVQDNQWGQRVNTTSLGIQFVKDGDAFGSGSKPANPDDFPDLDAEDDGSDDLMG